MESLKRLFNGLKKKKDKQLYSICFPSHKHIHSYNPPPILKRKIKDLFDHFFLWKLGVIFDLFFSIIIILK